MRSNYPKGARVLTLGDWQKTNQDEGILMSAPDVVLYVPDGEIHRMVLMLASRNRGCRFVGPNNDWDKCCTVHVSVSRYQILW